VNAETDVRAIPPQQQVPFCLLPAPRAPTGESVPTPQAGRREEFMRFWAVVDDEEAIELYVRRETRRGSSRTSGVMTRS
jgi:hypothetical protein